MKKFRLWLGAALAVAVLSVGAFSARTDIFSLQGSASLRNVDVFRIDSSGDLYLTDSSSYNGLVVDSATGEITSYTGDINLGGIGTAPTSSVFYGLKVPFVNASGQSLAQGHVLVWNSSGTAAAKIVGVTSTTTIAGICEGTVSAGSVGYMTVAGYALVLTTGAVTAGNVIVSTNIGGAGAVPGYAGEDASPDSGATIGRAVTAGTAAGGLTLTLLGL